ncbi:ubiquitin-conjugating enzyme E2 S [Cladophialophora psammophila CBS 110553]|uniref:Ubiquitin-conjugating enzyme E2 S n=1 Tax=Cladophialophora psammophila CBS 110553 TaxID=1182543 RepID=W9WJ74_9EURO|nr:ubiquitin-conjugating enzyme E2 S [Cladophialophora psammophila CBS 110553]EXJ68187.1 ubiquitin-conjugating enzyme E2 S [Cladophialophora psammophila CBS 110553]
MRPLRPLTNVQSWDHSPQRFSCRAGLTTGKASLRRLAKDHAALRSALPPNYLFPESDHGSSLQDDLTQLVVCITGAEGTPYSKGLWRLHLKMPLDYPKSPPKATFQTRIYHPNVDPTTGAVCLETLKRDWDPKLTLKDILVTISCLLIQPNPDSALNAAAGALIQESYDSFSTQAQLMTRIHAPIPKHLSDAVQEAKRRGEEPEHGSTEKRSSSRGKTPEDDTKENEPSESNTAFNCAQTRMKDKRSLSEIALSEESDVQTSSEAIGEPKRKSPKTTRAAAPDQSKSVFPGVSGELENHRNEHEEQTIMAQNKPSLLCQLPASISPATRRTSNISAAKKRLPRIGIRRL